MSASRFSLPMPRTRWSLISAICGQGRASEQALRELADAYRLPIHVYLRRSGCSVELAYAAARACLARLGTLLRDSPPQPGIPFRDYVRSQLQSFVTAADVIRDNEDSGDGGSNALERSYATLFPLALSADECFDRALGLGCIGRAMRRLRAEAIQTGHQALFELLKPFLAEEPAAGQYEVWARQQNVPALVLLMALRRLRQRFQELVDSEMMQSIGQTGEDARAALRRSFEGDEP